MKKFFSTLSILSLFFSPCVMAEEADLTREPSDIKLQKISEEANRNKELL